MDFGDDGSRGRGRGRFLVFLDGFGDDGAQIIFRHHLGGRGRGPGQTGFFADDAADIVFRHRAFARRRSGAAGGAIDVLDDEGGILLAVDAPSRFLFFFLGFVRVFLGDLLLGAGSDAGDAANDDEDEGDGRE